MDAGGRSCCAPAVLWDNYPVNDAGMVDELHIGPYRQRDGNLPVRGIYANPMSLAQASKLPLATFAGFPADPELVFARSSSARGCRGVVGEELVDALSVFAESVTISPLTPEQPQAMLDLVAPFRRTGCPTRPTRRPSTFEPARRA